MAAKVTQQGDDAKLNTLKTNLSHMRGTLETYYAQHNSTYPGGNTIAGVAAANDADCATAFFQQLTQYTDIDGTVSAVKDATHKYGPYVKSGKLPTNPFNNLGDITCDFDDADITVRDSTGAGTAWTSSLFSLSAGFRFHVHILVPGPVHWRKPLPA